MASHRDDCQEHVGDLVFGRAGCQRRSLERGVRSARGVRGLRVPTLGWAELVTLAGYRPAALSGAKQGQSGQSQDWPLTHAQFGQHNCPQHTASWAIAFTSPAWGVQTGNAWGVRDVPRTSTRRAATLSRRGARSGGIDGAVSRCSRSVTRSRIWSRMGRISSTAAGD